MGMCTDALQDSSMDLFQRHRPPLVEQLGGPPPPRGSSSSSSSPSSSSPSSSPLSSSSRSSRIETRHFSNPWQTHGAGGQPEQLSKNKATTTHWGPSKDHQEQQQDQQQQDDDTSASLLLRRIRELSRQLERAESEKSELREEVRQLRKKISLIKNRDGPPCTKNSKKNKKEIQFASGSFNSGGKNDRWSAAISSIKNEVGGQGHSSREPPSLMILLPKRSSDQPQQNPTTSNFQLSTPYRRPRSFKSALLDGRYFKKDADTNGREFVLLQSPGRSQSCSMIRTTIPEEPEFHEDGDHHDTAVQESTRRSPFAVLAKTVSPLLLSSQPISSGGSSSSSSSKRPLVVLQAACLEPLQKEVGGLLIDDDDHDDFFFTPRSDYSSSSNKNHSLFRKSSSDSIASSFFSSPASPTERCCPTTLLPSVPPL